MNERRERWIIRAALVLPYIGVVLALFLLRGRPIGPERIDLFLLFFGYILNTIGTEVGFHRLFSHRAFQAIRPVRAALLILGSMATEGPVFRWAITHRRHHEFSDGEQDYHSPKSRGLLGALGGLWHAHIGWLWNIPFEVRDYRRVVDLIEDPVLYRLGTIRMYLFWVALGLLLPALISGLVHGGAWPAFVQGFLWGGVVRIILKQNMAYAINSVGHAFGWQDLETNDESRNSLLAIPTLGAGWHNTHHAFPYTYSNQMRWWQLDPCSWIIRGLQRAGLAWDLRYPTEAEILTKKKAVAA